MKIAAVFLACLFAANASAAPTQYLVTIKHEARGTNVNVMLLDDGVVMPIKITTSERYPAKCTTFRGRSEVTEETSETGLFATVSINVKSDGVAAITVHVQDVRAASRTKVPSPCGELEMPSFSTAEALQTTALPSRGSIEYAVGEYRVSVKQAE